MTFKHVNAAADISTDSAIGTALPVRRLVSMVLLLTVKDRATALQFDPCPTDHEWKLRYNVNGEWFEMVPVPLQVHVSQDLRLLARLSWLCRLGLFIRRLARGRDAVQTGRLRLVIMGQPVELGITFGPALNRWIGAAERVTLTLSEETLPSIEAKEILRRYLRQAGQDCGHPEWEQGV
jgi:type IV pilus assembly protein PilB